jgi:hypothetical protein
MDMLNILKNMEAAANGEKPSAGAENVNGMRSILESFNRVDEAPMPVPTTPMTPPMEDKGQPVSMNISLNASGKENVEDLMGLMKLAGVEGSVPGDSKLDVDMDGDNQPDIALMPKEESVAEDIKLNDADKKVMQKLTGMIKQKQQEMRDARKGGYDEDVRMIASQLEDFYSIAELIQGKRPMGLDTSVMDLVHDMYDEVGAKFDEEYANEPEEQYFDTKTMIKDLSGGLNREKPRKAIRVKDPAVESLHAELKAMYESKKKS